jgi:glycolate oxidase
MNRSRAVRLLEAKLGPSKVLSEGAGLETYVTDDSGFPGMVPDAVVLADKAEDILETLAIAQETGVPVTPRGAGTGRTGGATPVFGGIVLALVGMRQILEIDRAEGLAVVEAGVVLADLHHAVEREGWFYPPDPNSAAACVIGGNVAENAAGPRALKYGPTRDYVLGMDAYLMGGRQIKVGRRTRKGVTGYDLTSLLVGSEGTLAVVDKIALKLVPKPEHLLTFSLQFARIEDAVGAITRLIATGCVPRCAELLDEATLEVMRSAGNPMAAGANAMLLLEVDGLEAACEEQADRVAEACERAGALEVLVAQSENQRSKLWEPRRHMSYAVRRLAQHKISEDVVVPRQRLGELLTGVRALSELHEIRALTYGHAGDGNMHVNFFWNDEAERRRVDAAVADLFRLTIALDGTLSGEHGVGALKAPYLPLEQNEELITLQRDLKRVFDPAGLLNPGKIFPTTHGAC